jgi:taurine ABC transporter substrate-binding protein
LELKRRLLSTAWPAAVVLTLGTVLAGCGAAATPSTAQLPTVVIGYENAPDPEAVAIEQNFFARDMHAHVQYRYFSSGPAALSALASGALNFMTTLGNPPTAAAIVRGVPLQVIWAMEQYTTAEGLVVRDSLHITSLKQMAGQSIALVQGSTSPFVLDAALSQAHMPADAVTEINMAPPAMVSAWKAGHINAAWVWVPFFSAMLEDGGHALLYDANEAATAPIFNLAVVNADWARHHVALVRGFVRAEEDGYLYYREHPAAAYRDMGRLNQITAAEARSQASGLRFLNVADQLTQEGLGTGPGVATSLVTKSLTAAAAWLARQKIITGTPPANMSQYVNPAYAAWVAQHP